MIEVLSAPLSPRRTLQGTCPHGITVLVHLSGQMVVGSVGGGQLHRRDEVVVSQARSQDGLPSEASRRAERQEFTLASSH